MSNRLLGHVKILFLKLCVIDLGMKVNYTVLSKAKTILTFQHMDENICILPKTSELNFKDRSPNGL